MTRKFGRNLKTAFKRFILPLLRSLLMGIISILFVHLPAVGYYLITFGKIDEKSQSHKRIRAKLTNPLDPSSPYRAIEVTDELQTTPDEYVQTLADIPDYCLEKYADRETLGVREILDIQDEKQPNGKIFKKVFLFNIKKRKENLQTFAFRLSWVNINSLHIVKHSNELKILVEVYYRLVLNQVIKF